MIQMDQENKQYDEIFVSELPSEMISCWNGEVQNQTLHFSTELHLNSISADSKGEYVFKSSPIFQEQSNEDTQFCTGYSRKVIDESLKSYVEGYILQQSEINNVNPNQATSRSEDNKLDESTHQIRQDLLENGASILINGKDYQNTTIPLKYNPTCIELCEFDVSIGEDRPKEQVTLLFSADCSEVHAHEVVTENSDVSSDSNSIRLKECVRTFNNVESENGDEKNEFVSQLFRSSNEILTDAMLCKSSIISMTSYSLCKSTESPLHLLAMACEDGSIRIIFYAAYKEEVSPDEWSVRLDIIKTSDFAVDGPITSLSFTAYHKKGNSVKLLVGSIWGFCCFFDLNECDFTFSGPFEIAKGLWNSKYNEDDAVTSLRHLRISNGCDEILIGLFSGKVVLLSLSNNLTKDSMGAEQRDMILTSNCIFHTSLPYPILAIQTLMPHVALIPDIIIITRRSIHVFRSSIGKMVNDTKERIEILLHKYDYVTKERDFAVL
jgi:hypothetical protein